MDLMFQSSTHSIDRKQSGDVDSQGERHSLRGTIGRVLQDKWNGLEKDEIGLMLG